MQGFNQGASSVQLFHVVCKSHTYFHFLANFNKIFLTRKTQVPQRVSTEFPLQMLAVLIKLYSILMGNWNEVVPFFLMLTAIYALTF